jgi:MFS family permease
MTSTSPDESASLSSPTPDRSSPPRSKSDVGSTLFRLYLAGNFVAQLGTQVKTVTVGWELYERTGNAFDLGLVGLVQVIPVVALALPAGQIIDRFDRRRVVILALLIMIAASVGLTAVSWTGAPVFWMYVCLFFNGVARAFQNPARAALLPLIVSRDRFATAVAWTTSGFQLATVIGPSLGGIMLGLTRTAYWGYLFDVVAAGFFILVLLRLRPRPQARSSEPISLQSLLGGLAFVWRSRIVLGAISLDMFAVLLGGATALLPIFAKDILQVGERGLGWLAAAPGLGALCTSLVIAHGVLIGKAGRTMLWSVAGFGVATIAFGFSRDFWFSWSMLVVIGVLDMISVIIRHTLVQMHTPDSMRGRVSAVNGVFISMSNEMGAFESGLVARLFHRAHDPNFGPTVSVVSGGVGTLITVLVIAWWFPKLRKLDRLT